MQSIQIVALNEQSPGVGDLQKALLSLDFSVDPGEVQAQSAGPSTLAAVRAFQKQNKIRFDVELLVDQRTVISLNRVLLDRGLLDEESPGSAKSIVRGTVTAKDGSPASGFSVTAYEQDLRNRQILGTATTDPQGHFAIAYTAAQYAQAEEGAADIVVVVTLGPGKFEESPVIFNTSGKPINIQLTGYAGKPQYEKVDQAITPLLARQLTDDGRQITAADLEQDGKHNDVTFIAAETGLSETWITNYIIAAKLQSTSKLDPQFWYALLQENAVSAGPAKTQQSSTLANQANSVLVASLALTASAAAEAITSAISDNIIAPQPDATIKGWLDAFAKHVYATATGAGAGSRPELAAIISSAQLGNDAQKQAVARAYLTNNNAVSIVNAIKADPAAQFSSAELNSVQTSLMLSSLTVAHPPLINALRAQVATPDNVSSLAMLGASDWVATLSGLHGDAATPSFVAGATRDEKIKNYAALLVRNFQTLYPTTSFAGGLKRAMNPDPKQPDPISSGKAILQFLADHPQFDLQKTGVANFIATQANAGTFNLQNRDAFTSDLKAVQRVFKVAPTFEKTAALLSDGIHSAQQIYRMGQTKFVNAYAGRAGFTSKSALDTFRSAANTHAAAVTLVGELRALQTSLSVAALNPYRQPLTLQVKPMTAESPQGANDPVADNFPDLQGLFGGGDFCDCDECSSTYGPAAYFVDLLQFLEHRSGVAAGSTARDVLLGRRPDLVNIELTCDNANVPLPYIDVVCDLLEDIVAPWTLFTLPASIAGSLAAGPVPAALATAFATAATAAAATPGSAVKTSTPLVLALAADAVISDQDANGRWILRDSNETYSLLKNSSNGFDVTILRQTRGAADELAAAPRYVNGLAYKQLADSLFPMTLPFNLYVEEARGYLTQVGVARADLLEKLHSTAVSGSASPLDVAGEYLRFTPEEQTIILKSNTTDGYKYWDASAGNYAAVIAALTCVDTFLIRMGLQFNDLLTLLTLEFTNPGQALTIVDTDDTCDASKKKLQTLDEPSLDRLHRFLRLWRKWNSQNGWKMWEVNLLLVNKGIAPNGLDYTAGSPATSSFLMNMLAVRRLMAKFPALNVEQVAALYDNINIKSKFVAKFTPNESSLYETLFFNKKRNSPPDPAFSIGAVTATAITETLNDPKHAPAILAATRLKQADLDVLLAMPIPANSATPAHPFLPDNTLSLGNLSIIYRHALLARLLKLNIPDYVKLIFVAQVDPFTNPTTGLTDPATTCTFVEGVQALFAAGLNTDQLRYVLAADTTGKSIPSEKSIAAFLTTLRTGLQQVVAENDPTLLPADVDGLTTVVTDQLQNLGWDPASVAQLLAILKIEFQSVVPWINAPAAFTAFPHAIIDGPPAGLGIPIGLKNGTLVFTGWMTVAQQTTLLSDASLSAATGSQDYINAINDLFNAPNLLLQFFQPQFTAPITVLPNEVNFQSLKAAHPTLAANISYDAGPQVLQYTGILRRDGLTALQTLSANGAYLAAAKSLFDQSNALFTSPGQGTPLLKSSELTQTLPGDSSAASTAIGKNLALAASRLAVYLAQSASAALVNRSFGSALGITPAMIQPLLDFRSASLTPNTTVVTNFTGTFDLVNAIIKAEFSGSSAALTFSSSPSYFADYYCLDRIATVIKKLQMTPAELQWTLDQVTSVPVLDFSKLPPVSATPTPAAEVASLNNLLNLSMFIAYSHQWVDDSPVPVSNAPAEPSLSVLTVVSSLLAQKQNPTGPYDAQSFADDVEQLTGWDRTDIAYLAGPTGLDLKFPDDYLMPSSWRRLSDVFTILSAINASAQTVLPLATSQASSDQNRVLKQAIQSQFGIGDWQQLSKAVQDVLRERKRDSLVGYLLTQTPPSNWPSQQWNTPNDLYDVYLIDVEMGHCQVTSRLVQGSAAIQAFVQRCFMGLEEKSVKVSVDTDSAWNQWTWMQQYRVWQANREVFLYPENWFDPQLRSNKSSFFTELEGELLQNAINADNVELAYRHYLEKLIDVSQLQLAGTCYEDETRTFHVFGRTPAGDPRLYYYRKWIQDQYWTPWTPVNVDIKADFVTPVTYNRRLYLVWPEYREQSTPPPKTQKVPAAGSSGESRDRQPKYSEIHLAISEYRNGAWSKKQLSDETGACTETYLSKGLFRQPFFTVPFDWRRVATDWPWLFAKLFPSAQTDLPLNLQISNSSLSFAFELLGCRGRPYLPDSSDADGGGDDGSSDPTTADKLSPLRQGTNTSLTYFDNDNMIFAFNSSRSNGGLIPHNIYYPDPAGQILGTTPTGFNVKYPHYLSFFDSLYYYLYVLLRTAGANIRGERFPLPLGTFYPWFFADKSRTFFVRPEMTTQPQKQIVIYRSERGAAPNAAPAAADATIRRIFYSELVDICTDALDLIDGTKLTPDQISQLESFAAASWSPQYLFKNFYHPFACHFATTLNRDGIDGLLSRNVQLADNKFDVDTNPAGFSQTYDPTDLVDSLRPVEDVDFDLDGSYSKYNWELFFQAPLMIANQLTTDQKFEDALRWYQYIFDPTGAHDQDPTKTPPTIDAPAKFWITKPFYQHTTQDYIDQRIDSILNMLATNPGTSSANPDVQKLIDQVTQWRENPFDPDLIAQYRTVAYQKATVMKCLDCLIAWGDYLFTQAQREPVMQALGIYIRAYEILGRRPRVIPLSRKPPAATYAELESSFDAFSDAMVNFENLVPVLPPTGSDTMPDSNPSIPIMYFCIPKNDKLLGYYDTIEDRLTKIRNCEDIEGNALDLALFAPPIDPGALVRALASGQDLSSAISDLNAPLPKYRFTVMMQKANELVSDLKALGGSLLSALEKKDAEDITLLRQSQEIAVLNAVRAIKQRQIDDAQFTVDGLNANRAVVEARQTYYQSRPFMTEGELTAATLAGSALVDQESARTLQIVAGVLSFIPDFNIGAEGFGGSPAFTTSFGGTQISKAIDIGAKAISDGAAIKDKMGSIASTLAGYGRRSDDWEFQAQSATLELAQIDQQIQGAQVKLDIANKELDNHDLQISNANAVNDFMHSKYTNRELYNWMVSQISQVYFQSYRLAYDLARRAQKCYEFELGIENSAFIQPGYWDNLKSGLLAGEQLQLALRRLDAEYLDKNRREFELTKHISLALLRPDKLVELKSTGVCQQFDLAEELFDLDYPGQYFRRIKSVSISIPCVAGPQTTVACTLRLLKSSVRINSSTDPGYPRNSDHGAPADDPRFRESRVIVSSISTSSAQNDSGMFELNFRDERYLPFEGAGAISTWQIMMMDDPALRQFDFSSISDLILHVRYTAREDSGDFRKQAVENIKGVMNSAADTYTFRRIFDLPHEFPTEWYAFLHPAPGNDPQLLLPITKDRFPFFAQSAASVAVNAVAIYARFAPGSTPTAYLEAPQGTQISFGPNSTMKAVKEKPPQVDWQISAAADPPASLASVVGGPAAPWLIKLAPTGQNWKTIAASNLEQAYLVIDYTLK